jgi:phosphotransferase system HPr (HPr) family protein
MSELQVRVADPAGLHAREAARFVRLASRFGSEITIRCGEREADAKSLIGILGLAGGPSTEITLVAEGADADAALAALSQVLAPGSPVVGTDTAPASSSTHDA